MLNVFFAFASAIEVFVVMVPWETASFRHSVEDAVCWGFAVLFGLLSITLKRS